MHSGCAQSDSMLYVDCVERITRHKCARQAAYFMQASIETCPETEKLVQQILCKRWVMPGAISVNRRQWLDLAAYPCVKTQMHCMLRTKQHKLL